MVIIVARLYPMCFRPIRRFVRADSRLLTRGQRTRARDKLLAILNMQFLLGLPWVSLGLKGWIWWT